MKEGIWSHFKEVFSEPDFDKPILEDVPFKVLTQEESRQLETPFSDHEIKMVVWDCEVSKSLSTNGFNFFFIRKC